MPARSPQLSAAEPPPVRAARERAGWVLGAAVGFTWGPLAMYFATQVWRGSPAAAVGMAALTLLAGAVGARVPGGWYRVRDGEPGLYRRLGVRWFKGWMMDGDRMNRRLRRLDPGYRFVQGGDAPLRAYAARTRHVERSHLAWMLAALPATAYALAAGRAGFAAALLVLNVVTNLYPVLLQRLNRGRVERVLARPGAGVG